MVWRYESRQVSTMLAAYIGQRRRSKADDLTMLADEIQKLTAQRATN
jgi:hypothetical protein